MPVQLCMSIRLGKPPKPGAAEGYVLRTFRAGDEAHWARIMHGNVGEWDEQKARREVFEKPQFDADATFFVVEKATGSPVGTACLWHQADDPPGVGWLHMVAVLDAHRGHRLGETLCQAVLAAAHKRRLAEVRLTTDDWRVGAIKTYLRIGFQPMLLFKGEDHTERWAALKKSLGLT